MEADLFRYYGLDLRDGDIGCRRLWVLLRGLPPEAAIYMQAEEPEDRPVDQPRKSSPQAVAAFFDKIGKG